MELTTITKHLNLDLFLGIIVGIILTIAIYKLGAYLFMYFAKKLLNKGVKSIAKNNNGGDFLQGIMGMISDPKLQQSFGNLLQPQPARKAPKRKTVVKKDSDTDTNSDEDEVDEMKMTKQRVAND